MADAQSDPVKDVVTQGTVSAAPNTTLRAYLLIVAAGAFATTFAQQRNALGNYPILFHLKDRLHFSKEQVSEFFLWATFAWNLKPLAGMLTDALPLWRSRRRSYLVLGGLVASASWIGLNAVRGNYMAFLAISIALNCGLVLASTAMGGLQVEAGQAYGLSGTVSSLRQIVMSVALLAGPLLGGWLTQKAFGYTTGGAAFALMLLVAFTLTSFHEKPAERPEPSAELAAEGARYRPPFAMVVGMTVVAVTGILGVATRGLFSIGLSLLAFLVMFSVMVTLATVRLQNPVLVRAQPMLSRILRSRPLWLAVTMLFLVYAVPGMNTALTYVQSNELKFSDSLIGVLSAVEGGAGILFALGYVLACRRLDLRALLLWSIGLNALSTLLFLSYRASTAVAIHVVIGGTGVLADLALMDLAVRSTPPGCEALGLALLLSVRNFGVAISDVIGSKLMDECQLSFSTLVVVNASLTALSLLFVKLLPRGVVLRTDGTLQGAPLGESGETEVRVEVSVSS